MAAQRSSAGDPGRTLALLWAPSGGRPRPGPRPSLAVGEILGAAIALADDDGLDSLTMRRVAQVLDVAPMTLYTYVPGKAELLDLMLDAIYRRMEHADTDGQPWRSRVETVARDNRALFRRHPWAATVSTVRPPLGPGLMAKYERELRALDGIGLDDVEMDAALTFVLGFVRAAALAEAEARNARHDSGMSDAQWWEANEPLLARVLNEAAYPTAVRVGAAAGAAHGAAYSPDHAFEFGLQRVLDGLSALIDHRGTRQL